MKHRQTAFQLILSSGLFLRNNLRIMGALAIIGMLGIICVVAFLMGNVMIFPKVQSDVMRFMGRWYLFFGIAIVLFFTRIASALYILSVLCHKSLPLFATLLISIRRMWHAKQIIVVYLGIISFVISAIASLVASYNFALCIMLFVMLTGYMFITYFIEQIIVDGETSHTSLFITSSRYVRSCWPQILCITAFLILINIPAILTKSIYFIGTIIMIMTSWHAVTTNLLYVSVQAKNQGAF